MYKRALLFCLACLLCGVFTGCHSAQKSDNAVIFLIESSPTSLDPRIGTDAWSAHIDELIFDGLVERNASFQFIPALADHWEQPDPLTLTFHLRSQVRFHDGRTLTANDVKWTIDSMRNGSLVSPKAASYASVDHVEAKDAQTVVFHLKKPDNFLLTNLSTGAIGIVPAGSGRNFWQSCWHWTLSLYQPKDRSRRGD